MNINPQNQTGAALEQMIRGIDRQEFYAGVLTRARIATIYDKYYPQLISKLPLNEDQAIRTLLVYSLRYINMSVQHVDVLLVNGLTDIARLDLDRPEKDLVIQLVQENREISDIDTISRIIGQINNKLPMDLQERYTPYLKIATIQKLLSIIGAEVIVADREASVFGQRLVPVVSDIGNNKEGFQSGSMNNRLDAANNNSSANNTGSSLDNNYLDDLDKVLGKNTVAELQKQGYNLKDISRERIKMNINQGTYEQQLSALLKGGNTTDRVTKDVLSQNVLYGKYVDTTPELHMDAKTKELYYFDETSRSLIPLKDVEKINADVISRRKLEAKLKDYELSNKELESIIMDPSKKNGDNGGKRKYNAKGEVINSGKFTKQQRDRLNLNEANSNKSEANNTENEGLDGWYIYIIVFVIVMAVLIGGYFGYRWYSTRQLSSVTNGRSSQTANAANNTNRFRLTK
jgi:hypothetical protein